MNRTIVSRKLMNDSKYSYCPYCMKELKENNMDNAHLNPLWEIVTKHIETKADGTSFPYFETFYECKRCKKFLTLDDFIYVYTRKTDGSRWSEPKHESL